MMNEQRLILQRLRRDEGRFCTAVESMWDNIAKKAKTHGTIEHLSLSFLMQRAGLDGTEIAANHGASAVIAYFSNVSHMTGFVYVLQHYRITLADARVLMELHPDGTHDLSERKCQMLAGNPFITRDLYDYLSARGYNCHCFAHLAHDIMRLVNVGQLWPVASADIYHEINRGLWASTTYTRLTAEQRKHLHTHKLTTKYLMMSATTPRELWDCEKTRHLMSWEYLERYFTNPVFSITHKLQTWSWVQTLPTAILGTCSRPYAILSHDSRLSGDGRRSSDPTAIFAYRPQLLDVIYMMCKYIPWIDYMDFNALLAVSSEIVMARACIDVLVIGAPVAWWKAQQPLTDSQKIQIALERGLPGAIDEIIRQLPSSDGAMYIGEVMGLYKDIRQCHVHRLAKAIARHWRTMTKRRQLA